MDAENKFAKLGDIFVSSWGYGMTIVSWYLVIKLTPKTVTLKELNSKIVTGDAMSGEAIPSKSYTNNTDAFVEGKKTIIRKITESGIKINSYEYAKKWDGQPKYFNHWD